jgi:hypothetical protein
MAAIQKVGGCVLSQDLAASADMFKAPRNFLNSEG